MQRIPKKQQGAVAIIVAVMLVVLLCMGSLAIDITRAYVVKNELQNAADAAALNGARYLYPMVVGPSGDDEPNWTAAKSNIATGCPNAAGCNASESITLVGSDLQAGYWNMAGSYPQTLTTGTSPGSNFAPALEVQMKRMPGYNSGPISTFLAPLMGSTTIDVSVTAIAVVTSPGSVTSETLLPYAMNKCMYDTYWDSTTNTPKLATTDTLEYTDEKGNVLSIPQVKGEPWVIRVGSSYHYGTCEAGQWTSFDTDKNDVDTIRGFLENGNPTPLAIGDLTWMQPGTKNTLYNEVPIKTVVLPVVNVEFTTHAQEEIKAFAPFQVTSTKTGSDPYIEGHFRSGYVIPGSSGIGPSYGANTPPRLAY